jgi:hypothetical protein
MKNSKKHYYRNSKIKPHSLVTRFIIRTLRRLEATKILIAHSSKQQVRTRASVTLYGSQLDDGLRSSKYP